MRLDKFLKVSRLIKRRTVANDVADLGRVSVNGSPAKASKQLKEGDVIKIENPNRVVSAKVLKIPQGNVSIQESITLYEIVEWFTGYFPSICYKTPNIASLIFHYLAFCMCMPNYSGSLVLYFSVQLLLKTLF